MSSKRKDMRTGMQVGKGKTSQSFEQLYAYILQALPHIVILENLREIFTQGDAAVTSDGVYVLQQMAAAGYKVVTYFTVSAPDHGSPASRFRIFYVCLRVLQAVSGNAEGPLADFAQATHEAVRALEVSRFAHDLIKSMSAPASDPEEFLERPLAAVLELENARDHDDEIAKRAKNNPKEQYKEEHMTIFMASRLKWPPVATDFSNAPHIMPHGMSQRVLEVAIICHRLYEKTALTREPSSVQFLDANNTLTRILHWDDEAGAATSKDVWKDLVPTLTQRSTILVRYVDDQRKVTDIRVLEGRELMFLIGFPQGKKDLLDGFTSRELSSLAGNAFSAFSIGPVVETALITAVNAGLTGDPNAEVLDVVSDGVDVNATIGPGAEASDHIKSQHEKEIGSNLPAVSQINNSM